MQLVNKTLLNEILQESGYNGWIGLEYKPENRTEEGLGWLKKYKHWYTIYTRV
jgi:hydroxypyruvate isomerase